MNDRLRIRFIFWDNDVLECKNVKEVRNSFFEICEQTFSNTLLLLKS